MSPIKVKSKKWTHTQQEKECITMTEAAELLGVSVPALRKNLNKVPHRRLGKRILFGRRALLDWLNLTERNADNV